MVNQSPSHSADETNEQELNDRLAEFADRLLDGDELSSEETAALDELQDLKEMVLLVRQTLPAEPPNRAVFQRIRSRLTREWRLYQTAKVNQSWTARLRGWLPQWPTTRRQTQRFAMAMAVLVMIPLLAFLFMTQYDGGRLWGTVINPDAPQGYPDATSSPALLQQATLTRPGLLAQISRAASGVEANHNSWSAAVSDDGRFIAFTSLADNLVPNDNNNASDIFLYDADSRLTKRISVGPNGEANGDSFRPAISGDGRVVAFASVATNLVAGDMNNVTDIFLYDADSDNVTLVSGVNGQPGNGVSRDPAISADGRYVAFRSQASNLVAGDNNSAADIFVYDRQAATMERVSVSGSGAEANQDSHSPAISGDGRYVAFTSLATNLGGAVASNRENVYLRDRQAGTTQLISLGLNGQAANSDSGTPSISANGQFIAFQSSASNLVANDNNNATDVFVYDRSGNSLTLVSVNNYGQAGNRGSGYPVLSADGRFVAFASFATNFSATSQFGYSNIFLHDRQAGVTEQISRGYDGYDADGSSVGGVLSADGRYVLFDSVATNLLPNASNGRVHLFRFDRAPESRFALNGHTGQPGSYFILSGEKLPPQETVAISINRQPIGTAVTDANGDLILNLDSRQADPGLYMMTADVNLLETHFVFVINPDAPYLDGPGSGPTIAIPSGAAMDNILFLPQIRR